MTGDPVTLLQAATFRVDRTTGEPLGTGFLVDEGPALTAAHVFEETYDDCLAVFPGEDSVPVDIEHRSLERGDVAVLRLDEEPPSGTTRLAVASSCPPVGEEVVWAGFARVVGEERRIKRRRFAWGKVASKTYQRSGGEFFDIDGEVNPYHSGSPVVAQSSGEVVGLISSTAGGLQRYRESRDEQMEALSEVLQLGRRQSGMRRRWGFESRADAVEAIEYFDALGLDYEADFEGGSFTVTVPVQEMPMRAAELLTGLVDEQIEVARRTLQMGIGTAATGAQILQHIDV